MEEAPALVRAWRWRSAMGGYERRFCHQNLLGVAVTMANSLNLPLLGFLAM